MRQKRVHETLGRLVAAVGPISGRSAPRPRSFHCSSASTQEVTVEDVATVVSRSKHARAFALGEALGDRDLPRALRALDEREFWEIKLKVDKNKSTIGLLYGLISKVRALLLLKEPWSAWGTCRPKMSITPGSGEPWNGSRQACQRTSATIREPCTPFVIAKALPRSPELRFRRIGAGHGHIAHLQPAPCVEQP